MFGKFLLVVLLFALFLFVFDYLSIREELFDLKMKYQELDFRLNNYIKKHHKKSNTYVIYVIRKEKKYEKSKKI